MMLSNGMAIEVVINQTVGAQRGHLYGNAADFTLATPNQALADRLSHIIQGPPAIHEAMANGINRPGLGFYLQDALYRELEDVLAIGEGEVDGGLHGRRLCAIHRATLRTAVGGLMKRCPRCMTIIDAQATRCPNCTANFTSTEMDAGFKDDQRRRSLKFLIFAGLFFAVIYWLQTGGAEKLGQGM